MHFVSMASVPPSIPTIWRTFRVRAPCPVHYSSGTNESPPRSGPSTPVRVHSWLPDLTGLRAPACSTLTGSLRSDLLRRSRSYRRPGPLTPVRHAKPSRSASPEAPFKYFTGFQQHPLLAYGFNVSPRLVLDEGVMTFGYLWQAGSCGFLGSYCFPFFVRLCYLTRVSCILAPV